MTVSFLRLALVGVLVMSASPAAAQLQGSPGYAFLQAVRDDKGAEVDAILAKPGSRIIDTQDHTSGETALHIVAKRNDSRYVSYLLSKGANPNVKDKAGNTPLMVAIDRGYASLIPVLLKGKANPNVVGDGGQTPLIKAVLRRDEEMVRLLIDGGADADRKDYLAGKSARDYANEDTRNTALIKLFADVPVKSRRANELARRPPTGWSWNANAASRSLRRCFNSPTMAVRSISSIRPVTKISVRIRTVRCWRPTVRSC